MLYVICDAKISVNGTSVFMIGINKRNSSVSNEDGCSTCNINDGSNKDYNSSRSDDISISVIERPII